MKSAPLAIFVLALGPVACSLLVDTEELAAARATAADAADYDADTALDASGSDAAVTTLDATSDAVSDGASGLRFCENPLYSAVFCADFDGTDPFEKFPVKGEVNGTLSVTSSADGGAAGLSQRNALRAAVSAGDGGLSAAAVSHLLQSADQDVSLSLSARFGPMVDVMAVAITVGSSQIRVWGGAGGFTIIQSDPADGGTLSQVYVPHSPSPDWVHLRFDIRATGPEPSLTFYIDGVQKLDRRQIAGGPAGLGTRGFSIGARLGAQTTPATIDYDNVLFDVNPLP